MPNRLTAVPSRPVPRLDGTVRALYPVADAFMAVMLSRPSSGSLRTTWVTPATLWLSVVLVLACLVGAALLVTTRSVPSIVVAAALVLATLGPASVAAVGFAQRRV